MRLLRLSDYERKIQKHRWDEIPKGIQVTASFGVTEWCPSESNLELTIARADSALYKAKQQGRNCVVSSAFTPEIVENTE